jgi:hypothetical protein
MPLQIHTSINMDKKNTEILLRPNKVMVALTIQTAKEVAVSILLKEQHIPKAIITVLPVITFITV